MPRVRGNDDSSLPSTSSSRRSGGSFLSPRRASRNYGKKRGRAATKKSESILLPPESELADNVGEEEVVHVSLAAAPVAEPTTTKPGKKRVKKELVRGDDGLWKKPAGQPPRGKIWDGNLGSYVAVVEDDDQPIIALVAAPEKTKKKEVPPAAGGFPRPQGRGFAGKEWDSVKGKWVESESKSKSSSSSTSSKPKPKPTAPALLPSPIKPNGSPVTVHVPDFASKIGTCSNCRSENVKLAGRNPIYCKDCYHDLDTLGPGDKVRYYGENARFGDKRFAREAVVIRVNEDSRDYGKLIVFGALPLIELSDGSTHLTVDTRVIKIGTLRRGKFYDFEEDCEGVEMNVGRFYLRGGELDEAYIEKKKLFAWKENIKRSIHKVLDASGKLGRDWSKRRLVDDDDEELDYGDDDEDEEEESETGEDAKGEEVESDKVVDGKVEEEEFDYAYDDELVLDE